MIAATPTIDHEMILLTQADLDGEVTASEAVAIAAHLAGCLECRTAYSIVRAARAAVQTRGFRYVMPADAMQAVMARLRQPGTPSNPGLA